jgi:hypothetical protein
MEKNSDISLEKILGIFPGFFRYSVSLEADIPRRELRKNS